MNDNNSTDTGHTGHGDRLTGGIFWVAIAFSAYQLWMASFHPLSSQVIRAIHVGFVLLMVFALFPPRWGERRFTALAWGLGLVGFVLSFYHWVFESDLTARAGELIAAEAGLAISRSPILVSRTMALSAISPTKASQRVRAAVNSGRMALMCSSMKIRLAMTISAVCRCSGMSPSFSCVAWASASFWQIYPLSALAAA